MPSVVFEVPTRPPSSSRGRQTILLTHNNIRLYTTGKTVDETEEALMVFVQMVRGFF